MSRFRIFTVMALFIFALGLALVGEAVAGEKCKGRNANYTVKSHSIEVADEEGHILNVSESKGILIIFEGVQAKKLWDGIALTTWGVFDLNVKTGQGCGHGIVERVDRDGDKVWSTWEGRSEKGGWRGTVVHVRGTGKFEGIKGKGTWVSISVGPNQGYTDWDSEVEWPR